MTAGVSGRGRSRLSRPGSHHEQRRSGEADNDDRADHRRDHAPADAVDQPEQAAPRLVVAVIWIFVAVIIFVVVVILVVSIVRIEFVRLVDTPGVDSRALILFVGLVLFRRRQGGQDWRDRPTRRGERQRIPKRARPAIFDLDRVDDVVELLDLPIDIFSGQRRIINAEQPDHGLARAREHPIAPLPVGRVDMGDRSAKDVVELAHGMDRPRRRPDAGSGDGLTLTSS